MKCIETGLPLRHVHYPGFYGAYFAFSDELNSQKYFCSCTKKSIENYIKFRLNYNDHNNVDPLKTSILSCAHFPYDIVIELFAKKVKEDETIIEYLEFKDGICHECNKQTPNYAYCHPMYGGTFVQNYGWYINKQSFEYGIEPVSFKILEELCPDEVFELIEIGKNDFLSLYDKYSDLDLIMVKEYDPEYRRYTKGIRKVIENEVRVKFGFKKVGEAWANETLLFQLVCELFPDKRIIRNYRPSILNFLELDVFIPDLNIGIEYQGIQHFEPVEHWGGQKALEKVRERDRLKKELCDENSIKLLYFYYYEELSKQLVMSKIETKTTI